MKHSPAFQRGASLIEVLVAVLILSFGMLALGGMLSYAVQMPKLAAYRAAAASLAAGHVERMRANTAGFVADSYVVGMTYNTTLTPGTACVYPFCAAASLAALDNDETNAALRRELPLGGMRVICNATCTSLEGDIWVMWQEPSTLSTFNPVDSDECPDSAVAPVFTAFSSPKPRCLHMRFKL
jgi:type IV pilus assembly protein PilV